MSKAQLGRDNSDIPLNDEPDWLDDFHNTLDKLEPKEIREASSTAELALIMSLNGFSREDRDLSEGDIWYGLITWLPHLYTRASMMKFNLNSVYRAGWRVLKENGGKISKDQMSELLYKIVRDTYDKENAAVNMVFACIGEFSEIDQESKDRVFEFLSRMKGSSSKLDAFTEAFIKRMTRVIIPENDIPEV